MREIVLNDLAKVHGVEYKDLKDELLECHAWNWYQDEYTVGMWYHRVCIYMNYSDNYVGAFAFFAAGNFSTIYREVTQPAADHLLHFAGEATSTNHA